VQAPQRRHEPSPEDRRKRLLLLAFAAVGLVALVVVVAVIALSGGSSGASNGGSSAVAATMRAAGCTYRDTPGIKAESNHANVTSAEMKTAFGDGKGVVDGVIHYWTYPPANGPHYGVPVVWNFYDQAVPIVSVVHNEEHGGMVIWWGPRVPSSTVDELREFYRSDPVSIVGTPAAKLGNKIAVTAWTGDPKHYFKNGDYGTGHVAICPRFDEKAFKAFRDAYRGKGPEGVPMDVNQPGT
jgi:hypothetical protein